MSNFDILDAWSEFSEYDSDQTLFTIGTISEYTNKILMMEVTYYEAY